MSSLQMKSLITEAGYTDLVLMRFTSELADQCIWIYIMETKYYKF